MWKKKDEIEEWVEYIIHDNNDETEWVHAYEEHYFKKYNKKQKSISEILNSDIRSKHQEDVDL